MAGVVTTYMDIIIVPGMRTIQAGVTVTFMILYKTNDPVLVLSDYSLSTKNSNHESFYRKKNNPLAAYHIKYTGGRLHLRTCSYTLLAVYNCALDNVSFNCRIWCLVMERAFG